VTYVKVNILETNAGAWWLQLNVLKWSYNSYMELSWY